VGARLTLLVLEARAAKVDDLDRTLGRMLQQHIFRLQVAMHHAVVAQQDERVEHLYREASYERRREAGKVVGLD
jgi:hypothetical protein